MSHWPVFFSRDYFVDARISGMHLGHGWSDNIDNLLHRCCSGDAEAMGRLFELLDHDLRLMARGYLHGDHPEQTLRATALLNEVFIHFLGKLREGSMVCENLEHFRAKLALQMQNVVAGDIRRKLRQKRGGGAEHISLDSGEVVDDRTSRFITLHFALGELRKEFNRQYKVFIYRELSGLTENDVADFLGISRATAARDYTFARAFLKTRIGHVRPEAERRFIEGFEAGS